jgi:hypothetical protein
VVAGAMAAGAMVAGDGAGQASISASASKQQIA